MTTFPALVPSSRTFTPGEYPATALAGYTGKSATVRHSNVFIQAQLQLTFRALSQADMLLIWAHYAARRGGFEAFALPTEIASYSSLSSYVPITYRWRYAGEGSVEDLPCGGHNVSLTLETAPPVSGSVAGAQLRMVVVLVGGAASIRADGAALSLSLSLADGQAGTEAPGALLSLPLSLAAGEATAQLPGAVLTLSLSLAAGIGTNGAADGTSQTITLLLLAGAADNGTSDYWSSWVAQNYGWEELIFIDWWGS